MVADNFFLEIVRIYGMSSNSPHTRITHFSLEKDAPETRTSQTPEQGRVVKFPRVGGLHHEYSRMAA
jgi:hypothetical protein